MLERFGSLGGTDTDATRCARHYRRHDRVVIVTDEQAHYSRSRRRHRQVPARVPVYTWNLAGYRAGHGPSGAGHRHTFGGLTDAAFRMVPLLEAGGTPPGRGSGEKRVTGRGGADSGAPSVPTGREGAPSRP